MQDIRCWTYCYSNCRNNDWFSSDVPSVTLSPSKRQVKRLDCTTDGRGKINFKIPKLIKRSESGNYKCQIHGRRQYEKTKALHVNWLEMECTEYQSEENYAFEMKCHYCSQDITSYKWKKIANADGKPLINDLLKDPNFKVSEDNESCTLTARILKVKLSDAGTYQCSVGKKLTATTHLNVKKAPFKMHIEDATAYLGGEYAKLVLCLSDKDQSTEVLNSTWFKEDEENRLTSLEVSKKNSRYKTCFAKKNSMRELLIKDVIPEDAGKYICKVKVKGRQRLYSCSGLLKVEDRLLHFENKASIVGEDVKICYCLSPNAPPIEKSILYKKTNSGTWKELARSDDFFKSKIFGKKYEVHYDSVKKEGFLLIPKVKPEDAGTYRCQCVIDKNNYYSTCELQVDEKEYIKVYDYFAMESEKAVIVCMYVIEDKVKAVKWYKQTSDGKQSLISSAEKYEINEKKETRKRLTIEYSNGATRMEIKNVTVNDSETYICQLETQADIKIKKSKVEILTASAELCVPWTIFDKKSNRNPAIVFMNSHFLVFCEHKNSAVLRRGKLMITDSIDWEEPKTILKERNASFQNMVPIVVNEEKGHAILMCIRRSTSQKKIIMIKTDDNGETWSKRNDVELKTKNFQTDLLNQFYIGPGHGVCLQSGRLVVSGVSEVEPNKNVLFVLTSEDVGKTWEGLLAPNPQNASLGTHSQVAEYANDRVCISCSLKDSKQRFHVFSNDGCTQIDEILEPTLLEANPECQAGIISVPMKSDAGYNLTANPSNSEKFENLYTVHLSENGCKSWTTCKLSELGSALYANGSDLAYYEVKDKNKISRGLACVYENGSNEEDFSIVMQLVSLDNIR